ncbi:hypothetical protein CK203_065243 [Vitis vinifera]|uniref:DNA/RNA-binding protein Alba-like domain-containing protein n=1 Tax=Vitis vinifera TaxID=29760 RepID=A0A438G6R3_VITVI|nr:hypothetical protein CK203_065243 [Vitis vinifera]
MDKTQVAQEVELVAGSLWSSTGVWFRCPHKTLGRAYLVGLRAEPCIAQVSGAMMHHVELACGQDFGEGIMHEKRVREIVLKAMGQAISKTVAIAEIIKKRIPRLHQDTAISSVSITDVWEPIEEGLVPLEMTRHVSMISITLSTRELNKNLPGAVCSATSMVPASRKSGNCLHKMPVLLAKDLVVPTVLAHLDFAQTHCPLHVQAPYHVEQPKSQYHYQPQNQPRQAARPPYNAIHMAEEGVVAEQEGVVGVGVGMEIIKTMAVTMVDTPTGAEVEAEAGVGGPIVVSAGYERGRGGGGRGYGRGRGRMGGGRGRGGGNQA